MGEKGKKYKDLFTFVLLEVNSVALSFFLRASTEQTNLEFSKLEEKFWTYTSTYH